MEIKIYILNVFAKTSEGGNPAGVVLDADSLSDDVMQKIAQKVGYSETGFVQKSNNADFKIRFFTKNGEADLCGHVTIATFYLMVKKFFLKSGTYTLETKIGIYEIEIKQDNTIFMNQNLPQFLDKMDKEEIAKSLNISQEIISDDFPIQIVTTGIKNIFIPIKSINHLNNIKPNFKKISIICEKNNAIGYHLFTLETKFDSTAHCRYFAPLFEIPEDAATGTAIGSLGCYLYNYGKLKHYQINRLIFEQGYLMKKPSEILMNLKVDNDKIVEVNVGGTATNIRKKIISI